MVNYSINFSSIFNQESVTFKSNNFTNDLCSISLAHNGTEKRVLMIMASVISVEELC